MIQETPKQPVPGVTIEAPNPQFSTAQRLSYIKITKENNVVLELEAKKHKHIYEALYYKTLTEQLLLEIEASKRAQAPQPQPQPTNQPVATEGPWEVPANTPSYDAEATTSGSMEELVTPIPESKPIMTVHHTDVDAD